MDFGRSLTFALLLSHLASSCAPAPPPATPAAVPARIVSLAPSVTEVLFALGLGDRIVGVTRYCDYPPEAASRPKVGGYLDVNYEAIVKLAPDLVILIREHADAAGRLAALGVPTLAVDHSAVKGILDSFSLVGERCAVPGAADALRTSVERRMAEVIERVDGLPRPRVMVAVGRSLETGGGGEIYVSGRDGYYADLVRLAGGENACGEQTLKFPALSAEGVARLDPDLIVEMVPEADAGQDDALLDRWRALPGVRAAREGRVRILGGDHVVVPGPRFVDLLEELSEVIHPIASGGRSMDPARHVKSKARRGES